MYSPTVRAIIGVLGLFMAWKFYSNGNMTSTYMVLIGVGLIVWGYFKNGTVYMAFQQLRKENYGKAETLLMKTRYPELLKRSQKSYYHFTKGFIELNKQNNDLAYDELKTALDLGLRTQNDTSIVTLKLASLELGRRNLKEAENFISRTKDLNHKPELNIEIERIEAEINAAQQRT